MPLIKDRSCNIGYRERTRSDKASEVRR